jgi:hypothetical protein
VISAVPASVSRWRSLFLVMTRRSGECPSYLLSRPLHIGSMLRFVKNWANCKILILAVDPLHAA